MDYIIGLTVTRLRGLLDSILVRQKNEYRMNVVTPFEWAVKMLVQSTLASGGAEEKVITKAVESTKFPWEDDSEKISESEIEEAGGDPDNPFWFIETGDLSAIRKNAGKSLDNFKLSN